MAQAPIGMAATSKGPYRVPMSYNPLNQAVSPGNKNLRLFCVAGSLFPCTTYPHNNVLFSSRIGTDVICRGGLSEEEEDTSVVDSSKVLANVLPEPGGESEWNNPLTIGIFFGEKCHRIVIQRIVMIVRNQDSIDWDVVRCKIYWQTGWWLMSFGS